MPVVGTKGAMSSQGFGEFAQANAVPNYIEDVFSTWLYTGNGSSQTITNNIDLSTKGGMTWIKARSNAASNAVFDTVRGANVEIQTNTTNPNDVGTQYLTAFTTSGFSVGSGARVNSNTWTYASWTFREQPKFFDVVTYTGNGSGASRFVSHSLGSTPGMVIIKSTSAVGSWIATHRSLATDKYLMLNESYAQGTSTDINTHTSTNIQVKGTNDNGVTYIAYLFAHDAGGFGLTGTDNVITCGSFTGNGATPQTVNLGYEAQWVLVKNASATDNWYCFDNMRGISQTSDSYLRANTNNAEGIDSPPWITATATGFIANNWTSGNNYIYIAIRRGPMKVPTSGTTVFSPINVTSTTNTQQTTGFPVDMQFFRSTANGSTNFMVDRLRGFSTTNDTAGEKLLDTVTSQAEQSATTLTNGFNNTGFKIPSAYNSTNALFLSFGRAPKVFDVVCYTGTGVNRQIDISPSFGATRPEFVIYKKRDGTAANWIVYPGVINTANDYLTFNSTNAISSNSTIFPGSFDIGFIRMGTDASVNNSGSNYVAYVFATLAGICKTSTYTGTGATQTISCGFTGGARFVMIKRTDSTGNWWFWDTARGMVAGTDPRMAFNSYNGNTNANWVYTTTGGFQIVTTDAEVNASGGTYLYLAIA
jgi:hypothetical protein